jgi:hypothetical protein
MWVTSDLLVVVYAREARIGARSGKGESCLINQAERRHRAAIDLSTTVAHTAAQLMRLPRSPSSWESGDTAACPEPAAPVDG